MAPKNWTTKEVSYVRRYALLAETNQVLNIFEMAKKLGRSHKSVEMKIYSMQKDGQLPSIDMTKAFDADNRPFTAKEDERLISMIKQGARCEEIGESLGRSKSSISGRVWRLRQTGKLKHYLKKAWSDKEIQLLVENIQFDKNGFVSNYAELAQLTKKTSVRIQQKIHRLRKEGLITVQPDRTKTSVKSKQAMNRFNDARFAQYKKKEKPAMENKAQTDVQIETQSQMIQVIMTTVIAGSEKTINFFSTDGQLLAIKKEPVSFADDTSQNINI